MPAGRPTHLTPEVQAEAIRLAAAGVPKRVVAESIGINRQQFFQWLRWGDPNLEPRPNEHVPKDRTIYLEFADAFARARAQAIILCEATWLKAVKDGDAAQAAHWLKTHEPSLYREEIDVNVSLGAIGPAMEAWRDSIREMRDKALQQKNERRDS